MWFLFIFKLTRTSQSKKKNHFSIRWWRKSPQTWRWGSRPVFGSAWRNVCIKIGFFHFAKWGPSPCLLAHRWPVWLPTGSANGRWFKWISITENWLAGINHNKNGTCGLSSLKDRLPWDTAETSPIICPSEAETMGKSIERISVPEGRFSKEIKIQFTF